MSYAFCRMIKKKSSDLKDLQFHNQREKDLNIKDDRSQIIYDLVNTEKIDYIKQVEEIIESQMIGTRKIRKDAVLVNELLITPNPSFIERLDRNEQKYFFEEVYKLFSERYGKQNIAYAIVDRDEKKPYLRLGVVPMRDGKLQGKHVFNQLELQWIQSEFPKYMKKQGFDLQREEQEPDQEYVKTPEFMEKPLHEKQKMEKAIKNIEYHLSDLKKTLDYVNALEKAIEDLKLENMQLKMGIEKLKGEKRGAFDDHVHLD